MTFSSHAFIGNPSAAPLEEVIITEELALRPFRPPNFAAENQALVGLARTLTEAPETVLQQLCESACDLCGVGSAGISLEEIDGDEPVFRWHATTGAFSHYLGATMPRQSSPCGVVLKLNAPQLLSRPARHYTDLSQLGCEVAEVLLVPFHRHQQTIGTIWVVAHDDQRRFDAEDVRLMTSLASFASAAVVALQSRQQAERMAAESTAIAQRYAALFNAIDEGFCIIELMFDAAGQANDYRFLELNPMFEKHTGIHGASGKRVRELVPNLEAHWFETYGRVALTGEPVRFVEQARQMGDRWFDVYAFRLGGDESRIVALLFRDISERRRQEMLLRDNERRLQLAVDIAQMGTFEIDLVTDRVSVNETGRDIYGWANTETSFAHVQSHFHPDDTAEVLRRVSAAFDPAGPRTFEVEQRIYRTDGALRWIRVKGRAIFDEQQPTPQAIRCVGTYLDITQAREAEEALRDSDRRKDEFLAILAHELRNPLAPIRNGLQVMRMAADDPSLVGEARDVMERQLSHMVRLIDDLLDVSRISRGKMELRRSRVLLSDVLASALETARPIIDSVGHQLTIANLPEPIYLDGDFTRLSQIFANLLSNSAKYTHPGGHIWLTTKRLGDQVQVSIRDNGAGIPPESLRSIFDMFSQIDRTLERTTGGLGIGLALVRDLVELHGGAVSAHSDGLDQGATFTVQLPIETNPSATSGSLSNHSAPAIPRRRVLVVDDNRDAANTLATMLRLHGSEVEVAYDGVEAVAAAEQYRPELLLVDIGMPRMNGYEVARHIRSASWGRAMFIVALTGWGQASDIAQSRSAGCNDHLVKPVSPEALQRVFAELGVDG